MDAIASTRETLLHKFESLDSKRSILRSLELKQLYAQIKDAEDKQSFGQAVNELKTELEAMVEAHEAEQASASVQAIDAANTAPQDRPQLLTAEQGSKHPLMQEISSIIDIFARMGFSAVESRQIDDEYHMFDTLNFPDGHPARDEYDTFVTEEGFVAPAHTSIMQNRILKDNKQALESGQPIAYIIPGRVFRNEDVDARHEHTFYQFEGIYGDKGVHAGMLIATLQTFLQEYYGQDLEVRTQPFYFPFTEPSFELALSCPFCKKAGCKVCSQAGWIELLGCGMIHPNVLSIAGIDPTVYTGFAWGCGVDRLVMMKQDIEDVRHFHSGNLKFLRQF